MAPSPTGIQTEAWIWLRAVQFSVIGVIFIAGCVDTSRLGLVLGLFFPLLQLTLLVLLDTIIFYKKRYAHGPGRVSTFRWIMDLVITLIFAIGFPVVGVTHAGSYQNTVAQTTLIIELVLVGLDAILFFSTFVMLCVEDARLRNRRRIMLPSATAAMPSEVESVHEAPTSVSVRQTPIFAATRGSIDPQQASEIMNNILRNGFTLQQLERMGAARAQTPSIVTTSPVRSSAYESGPPMYKEFL